jgi:hypothetical protein
MKRMNLLSSTITTQVGHVRTWIALPRIVLETIGSAARTGLTRSAVILDGFLLDIYGGALTHRFGDRRSSVNSDFVSVAGVELVVMGSRLEIPGLTGQRPMPLELNRSGGTVTSDLGLMCTALALCMLAVRALRSTNLPAKSAEGVAETDSGERLTPRQIRFGAGNVSPPQALSRNGG